MSLQNELIDPLLEFAVAESLVGVGENEERTCLSEEEYYNGLQLNLTPETLNVIDFAYLW